VTTTTADPQRLNSRPGPPAIGVSLALLALLASLHVNASAAVIELATAPARPNVLIILADDLGYSDIGAYGSEIHTPNIDALAQQSAVFSNFHATPLCSPTRADLLTGADHHIVGAGALLSPLLPYQRGEDYQGFNSKARTVAQILKGAGYHTYMAGKWHVSSDGPNRWGFEQSFYLQPDAGNGNNFAPTTATANDADEPYYENGVQAQLPADFFSSDYYTHKLQEYIDANRGDGRPFFAYLAFQATHNPLQAPDAYLNLYHGVYDAGYEAIRDARIRKQKELGLIPQDFVPNPGMPLTAISPSNPDYLLNVPWALLPKSEKQTEARQMEVYASMVQNMDDNIGQLLAYLRRTGLYDNTLIIFLSDNGPDGNGDINPSGNVDNSLANYGKPGSYITRSVGWSVVSSAPFRGFKASIYEGGTSVPAIVRLPDPHPLHQTLNGLASVLDLLPTILDQARLPNPGTTFEGRQVAPLEGISLLPALRGQTTTLRGPDDVLVDEVYNHRYVIKGDYKLDRTALLYYGWSVLMDHDWQLFDIAIDRSENTVLDQRSIHTPTRRRPGDPYADVFDDLITQWNAYVQRTGLSLPPGQ
jgi:arylsulfatase